VLINNEVEKDGSTCVVLLLVREDDQLQHVLPLLRMLSKLNVIDITVRIVHVF
jgi:hypothetical protein